MADLRGRFPYQAFYCEENVWHLAQHPDLGEQTAAVFITNAAHQVPLWSQRAGRPEDGLVLWDYHAVLLQDGETIWDLDCRLGAPLPAAIWLQASVPPQVRLPAPFEPRFRVVPRAELIAHFASDRSHMRSPQGRWRHPLPPWPPIRTATETMTLPRFLDPDDAIAGEVLTLDDARLRWG